MNDRQLFQTYLAKTSNAPLALEIEKADGCYVYDKKGKAYLDLISGISVSNIGHRNPSVIHAIQNQLDKYLHLMVFGEFIQTPQVQFAEAIAQSLPKSLNTVYFTNSGTEATEGAMKLTKRATGRSEIISFDRAYHGSSQGALSLAGSEELKKNFRPLLPQTRQLTFNSVDDLIHITHKTAAVFIELIQSEAGCRRVSTEFIIALRKKCEETGTLLVFDEIQTGLGRTGTTWAMEWAKVVPDILLTGKALGGGMPLGAFVASADLMKELTYNPVLGHITTFGGHPVCCAAGLAAFDFLKENNLTSYVNEKEALFRSLLRDEEIIAVHGKGLLLAVELRDFDMVQNVINNAAEQGLITDWFLFNDKCLRIAPPLIITDDQIMHVCKVIVESIKKIEEK